MAVSLNGAGDTLRGKHLVAERAKAVDDRRGEGVGDGEGLPGLHVHAGGGGRFEPGGVGVDDELRYVGHDADDAAAAGCTHSFTKPVGS